MKSTTHLFGVMVALVAASSVPAAEPKAGENPAVSDDGRFIAFQMAKSREAAGVGHGIFVYDIGKANKPQPSAP
jgi:hypothetical protein